MSDDAPTERLALLSLISGIPGWLPDHESWELYLRTKSAGRVALNHGMQPAVVEIGSWKGRSTVTLALALQSAGGGVVYAIDPHNRTGHTGNYSEVLATLSRAGLQKYVRPLRLTSHEARRDFSTPLDVLFIDGDRSYDGRFQDIDEWTPLVKSGGIVAINNPSFPEVHAALRKTVLVAGSVFRSPVLVDNLLFVDVRRDEAWIREATVTLWRLRLALAVEKFLTPLRPYVPAGVRRLGRRAFTRIVRS